MKMGNNAIKRKTKGKAKKWIYPIKTLKVYSNTKIAFLQSLDKGIRGVCSMILDLFEARCRNEESKQDNYMIVYASQSEIADTLGFTREYI